MNLNKPIPRSVNANLTVKAIAKPSNITSSTQGALWVANDTLFHYGGDGGDNELWSFDTNSNTFTELPQKLAGATDGSFATSPAGVGYYMGGVATADHSDQLQLVRSVNLATMDIATMNFTQPETIADSQLIYMPFGQEGILVSIGGNYLTGNKKQPVPMQDVWVYDIYSDTWAKQNATAGVAADSIPAARSTFCAVPAIASGSSSAQIVFYGGLNSNGVGLDDLWMLSLPDFNYYLYAGGTLLTAKSNASCAMMGPYYMLIGGYQIDSNSNPTCLWDSPSPLAFYDIVNNDWSDYVPNLSYSVPIKVRANAGTQPAAGWSSSTLDDIFNNRTTRGSHTNSSSADTTTSKSDSGKSSSHTGAIAGGVVGGVVGLAIILAGLVWFLRRGRRRGQPGSAPVQPELLPLGGRPAELEEVNAYRKYPLQEADGYEVKEATKPAPQPAPVEMGVHQNSHTAELP